MSHRGIVTWRQCASVCVPGVEHFTHKPTEKYPEIDSYVMVNVRQVSVMGALGWAEEAVGQTWLTRVDCRHGSLRQTPRVR